ncbi:uncharacterized protein LOC118179501 [Stegodyphus dumicola]|uniref:uncharacterized protein LOC118179501 n=1 Tax=Stegodyphus dumicola TaxID=202533 RepID=UPI0015ABC85D|nr:uncharacterized protein LOC118179501 [Stegodyphus dumicola]
MCQRAQDKAFLEEYTTIFREWEKLNIIEKVTDNIETGDSTTTKIRPVFDASARESGKCSLNDLLYKGPNLLEIIPDILDRFRIHPIGLSSDIEKAFLMLSIAPQHRDFLRFFIRPRVNRLFTDIAE